MPNANAQFLQKQTLPEAFLPKGGVAGLVKDGDHLQGLPSLDKEHRVREALHQGSPGGFMRHWKLLKVVFNGLDYDFNFTQKLEAAVLGSIPLKGMAEIILSRAWLRSSSASALS